MNKKMKTADKAFTLLKNTMSVISEFSGVQGTRYFGQMLDLLYKELQWNGILDDSAAVKSKEQLQSVLKDAFSEYLKTLPSGKRRLMGTVRADVEYDFFKAVEHASLDMEMIEKSVNRALESAAAGERGSFLRLWMLIK